MDQPTDQSAGGVARQPTLTVTTGLAMSDRAKLDKIAARSYGGSRSLAARRLLEHMLRRHDDDGFAHTDA